MFQWLLTIGIVAAAGVGMYFSLRVDEVAKLGNAQLLYAFKDHAWRGIFWVSLPPGLLFVIGSFWVAESPRWLFRRGKQERALEALLRSRTRRSRLGSNWRKWSATSKRRPPRRADASVAESLLKRKYVIPFLLGLRHSGLQSTTGINSIIGYNTTILIQSGLSDVQAHWGYILFTLVQCAGDRHRRAAGGSQRQKISVVAGHSGRSGCRCC